MPMYVVGFARKQSRDPEQKILMQGVDGRDAIFRVQQRFGPEMLITVLQRLPDLPLFESVLGEEQPLSDAE